VAACVVCTTVLYRQHQATVELMADGGRRRDAGQVGAFGEGGEAQGGGAVGPWRHSREVREGSRHNPSKLDFTVPLNKYSRLQGSSEHMARGLGFDELSIHTRLEQPDGSYASEFPHSYFAAQPNPNSEYTWVCPGPSLLDDSHR
jgi:hypothetical protein